MLNKNEFYMGIDIGGTTYKCGIIDSANNIVYKEVIPSNPKTSVMETFLTISELIDRALSRYCSNDGTIEEQSDQKANACVRSIGMGVPGVISNDGVVIVAPAFPNWCNAEFGGFFRNKYSQVFTIDNDANAAAVAELVAGNGVKYKNFIYITLGTGVGGAIIIDKKIFRGESGGAGEIGHLVIDINHFDENLPIYRNGTVEELLGKYAIIRCATEIIKKQQYSESLLNSAEFIGNKEEIDVSDISKAANLGDKAALECFNLIGKYLGITIASLANIFDISNFIIGGGISQSDIIINAARKISKERSLPPVSARINVETARYLNDTGIIGAALLGKLEILK